MGRRQLRTHKHWGATSSMDAVGLYTSPVLVDQVFVRTLLRDFVDQASTLQLILHLLITWNVLVKDGDLDTSVAKATRAAFGVRGTVVRGALPHVKDVDMELLLLSRSWSGGMLTKEHYFGAT